MRSKTMIHTCETAIQNKLLLPQMWFFNGCFVINPIYTPLNFQASAFFLRSSTQYQLAASASLFKAKLMLSKDDMLKREADAAPNSQYMIKMADSVVRLWQAGELKTAYNYAETALDYVSKFHEASDYNVQTAMERLAIIALANGDLEVGHHLAGQLKLMPMAYVVTLCLYQKYEHALEKLMPMLEALPKKLSVLETSDSFLQKMAVLHNAAVIRRFVQGENASQIDDLMGNLSASYSTASRRHICISTEHQAEFNEPISLRV